MLLPIEHRLLRGSWRVTYIGSTNAKGAFEKPAPVDPSSTIPAKFESIAPTEPLRTQLSALTISNTAARMRLLLDANCASDALYEAVFGEKVADVDLPTVLVCAIEASAQLGDIALQQAFEAQRQTLKEVK